jgi:enoyl-CoA hydratase/carnithine racemase
MTQPELVDSTLEIDGRIAVLTLNRDDVRNELTGTRLSEEIVTVVDWINGHEGVSCLIVTGAGSAFSAGGNVKHMQNREQGSFAGDVYTVQNRYRSGIQRMALAMHRLEVPSIAAINGAAIGAGCDLACMCDVRVASQTAKIGETFVNLGIIPGDGGGWFLQRLLGYQRAAEMTFSGRVLDAAEAKAIGLVLEVVEPDELLAHARSMAAGFAAKPPRTVRLTKRLLKSAQKMELPEYLELCALMQGICHQTEDHGEAVSAFLEKRTPVYQGR